VNGLLGAAWAALAGGLIVRGAAARNVTRTAVMRVSRERTRRADRFVPRSGHPQAVVAVLVLAGAIAIAWPVAIAAAFGWWIVRPVVAARLAGRRRRDSNAAALAHVVDLLTMCIGAGLTLPLALDAVASFSDTELAVSLGRAAVASRHGVPLGDALERVLIDIGEEVRPLIAVLTDSERYGVSIADGITRLADEVRREVRRRAEERARRVPVKLLLPLVVCTLPAFVLLTLVPLVLGALAHLRLPGS
jgi:tight adherence protein C